MGQESQRAEEQKISIAPMLSVRNGAKAIEFYNYLGSDFRLTDVEGNVVQKLLA